MIELGRYGKVIAVPAAFVEVLIGTRVVELVLAAYTLVVVLPVTVAVTTFRLYWAVTVYCGGAPGNVLLQPGGLQVAVIDAVPGATAVRTPGLLPAVPAVAETLALDDEAQVRGGLMYCPALSKTSAVSGCVPPLLKVNEVFEELASCTRM
jgi:hypothetical protein